MNVYEIRADNGSWTEIQAKSRKEAVKEYIERSGMPEDFFKEHCIVKNLGKVIRERWGWIKNDQH